MSSRRPSQGERQPDLVTFHGALPVSGHTGCSSNPPLSPAGSLLSLSVLLFSLGIYQADEKRGKLPFLPRVWGTSPIWSSSYNDWGSRWGGGNWEQNCWLLNWCFFVNPVGRWLASAAGGGSHFLLLFWALAKLPKETTGKSICLIPYYCGVTATISGTSRVRLGVCGVAQALNRCFPVCGSHHSRNRC